MTSKLLYEATTEAIASLEYKMEHPELFRPVDTGIPSLNKAVGGIIPGTYVAILGKAKVGKTTVMNHFATMIASAQRGRVNYNTLEELQQALAIRSLTRLTTKTTREHIRDLVLEEEHFEELRKVNEMLKDVDMYLEDRAFRMSDIIASALKEEAKWVVVDYAQLLEDGGAKNEQELQVNTGKQIMKARNEHGLTFVVAYQLNEDGKIHGSRAAYKDADLVLQINEVKGANNEVIQGSLEIEVLASRQAASYSRHEVAANMAHGRIQEVPKVSVKDMFEGEDTDA